MQRQNSRNTSRISNAESAVFCDRPKIVQLYIQGKTKTCINRDLRFHARANPPEADLG